MQHLLRVLGIAVLFPVLGLSVAETQPEIPNIEKISAGLRPLALQTAPPPPTPEEKIFLTYYGLDFNAVERHSGTIKAGGQQIAVHTYRPPGTLQGTILLVHGYLDHSGVWRHLLPKLFAAHFAVVVYDQPGHGLSGGTPRVGIKDFSTYQGVLESLLALTRKNFPEPIHLVAHSMGGGIVADYLLAGNEAPGKVVLMAPLIRSANWKISRLGFNLVGQHLDPIPRKFRKNSGNRDFLKFCRRDPLQYRKLPACWVRALGKWNEEMATRPPSQCPLLVIQGSEDGTVDWKYNLKLLAEKFPNLALTKIIGAHHQLANETKTLRNSAFQELLDYLQKEVPDLKKEK